MRLKLLTTLFLIAMQVTCSANPQDQIAAAPGGGHGGGGGGGGHGGGGGGRMGGGGGARVMNRSPSMSRPGSYRNYQQRGGARQHITPQNAAQYRQQLYAQNPNARNWFNRDFFRQHNYNPYYYGGGGDYWSGSDWNTVNTWLGTNWAQPIAYDQSYDTGDQFPYPPPPQQTLEQEAPPAQPIAGTVPGIPSSWIPLGVFALGNDGNDIAYTSMFIQLALGKNGYVGGTYYNSVTNQAYPIEGSLNKESQQIVWKVSNRPNSPVLRTTLYSLTQDATDVTVRFPNGADQIWYMLRVTQ